MGDYDCFLVTIYYAESSDGSGILLKCALKVKRGCLPEDCVEYPMEPENRRHFRPLLPEHVRSAGPIVDIDSIFEVHCIA